MRRVLAGLFPRASMPPRPQRLPAPGLSREWRERTTGPAPATIGPISASMVPSSLREALVAAARPLAGRQHPFTPDMLYPHMCLCGMAEADPWHERPQAPAAAEEPPPEPSPPPGGVLGYVVVLAGEARSTLTDSDLKTRSEAEAEAAAWAKREAWRGRVTVCEVRAAGEVSG